MKNKKYLSIYELWAPKGKMLPGETRDTSGLCDYFNGDPLFELMKPTVKDEEQLRHEGKSTYVWASDVGYEEDGEFFTFNPLRQTIVLFMAAMNDEL